jgi:hypothetical protein
MESIMARITLAVGFGDERSRSRPGTLTVELPRSFRSLVTILPRTASGASQVV